MKKLIFVLTFTSFALFGEEVANQRNYNFFISALASTQFRQFGLDSDYYRSSTKHVQSQLIGIDLAVKMNGLGLGIKLLKPINGSENSIDYTFYEPYKLKRKMGNMQEINFKFYPLEIFKIAGYENYLPYFSANAGIMGNSSIRYERLLVDKALLSAEQFNSISYLNIPATLPDSLSINLQQEKYFGFGIGMVYKFSTFFFGAEIGLNRFLNKPKTEVLLNSQYAHYSQSYPLGVAEIFIRQVALKNRFEVDTDFQTIYFLVGFYL